MSDGGFQDIEPFQDAAWDALCGPATHVLLAGGARSGKTYLAVKFLCVRAMAAPEATQAVLRFRFNHLKASIIYDTLPMVMKTEWPGKFLYRLNKSDWYAEFVNGHKIYFGGLDDKERTEKILGQGHSTIYLNEASQISWSSRLKAITRLSQNSGLRLKEISDENPPMTGHWTERLYVKGVDPSTGKKIPNPEDYAMYYMQPKDNPHIPEATKRILQSLPPRERIRFWEGKFGDAIEGPLWTYESIEASRVEELPPTLSQVIIAVDPSGAHGPEDVRSDEVGIVALAIDIQGIVYVLEDASDRIGPGGPDGWGMKVVKLYKKWAADRVVAETNFGGAMVGAVIQSVDDSVPFKEVKATRGKAVRAEPVAALYDKGRVKLAGTFPELEEQMIQFSTAGYNGAKSPDRADAMVWGVHDLAIETGAGMGLLDFAREQAEIAQDKAKPNGAIATVIDNELVVMEVRPGLEGTVSSRNGNFYVIDAGRIKAKAADVDDLVAIGFRRTKPEEQVLDLRN